MRYSLLPTVIALGMAVTTLLSVQGAQRPLLATEEQGIGCPGTAPSNGCCHCANYQGNVECTLVAGKGNFQCSGGQGQSCPPTQTCDRGPE